MTNKAYIVANEQQEHKVLNDLERQGIKWVSGGEKPTEFTPKPIQFPYGLFTDDEGHLQWGNMRSLEDEEIVYDGRKEEHMSDKYVVSQKLMNDLKDWKDTLTKHIKPGYFIDFDDLNGLPETVYMWWGDEVSDEESNNRLIAIIRWVNGEDVFKVETHSQWIVRSKGKDGRGKYFYVSVSKDGVWFSTTTEIGLAKKFDSKEEADKYTNVLTESVQYN